MAFLLLLDQEREREVRKERAQGRKRKRAGAAMVLLMAVAAPAGSLRRENTGEEEVLEQLGWRRSRRGVAAVAGWLAGENESGRIFGLGGDPKEGETRGVAAAE